jgi:uncharacterized protein YebE (UPF0316 family)
MFSVFPSFIVFPVHLTLQMISLAFWALCITLLGLIKFILPFPVMTKPLNIVLNFMMCAFGFCSVVLIKCMNKVELDYVVEGELSKHQWYLIVANPRSWLDIILLADFTAG